MKSWVGFISAPTADTPGTLAYFHFNDRRYLIGSVSEGSTRACIERTISLRKVSNVFLTGRTKWSNIGGLLGMILGLADTKKASDDALMEGYMAKSEHNKTGYPTGRPSDPLNIHGAPNLNYAIATGRRFIFRHGMPLNAIEYAAKEVAEIGFGEDINPTYVDDRALVWIMPIRPKSIARPVHKRSSSSPGTKRTFEEANMLDGEEPEEPAGVNQQSFNEEGSPRQLSENIVRHMFNSDWSYDRLVPCKLEDVRMPAECFVKDAATGGLINYEGPKPGEGKPLPPITVFVREPWPASNVVHLPPTQPALESMCYIIRNHEQRGKFLPDKAKQLKVPKGELWTKLTMGESVSNTKNETITPAQVMEPSQPGNGCAFVELPTVDYIEPCIARPEWTATNVVRGLGAIVWILGPGVGADARLRDFQGRWPDIKHFVASSDYSENHIALESAAVNALRNSHVYNEVFPPLCSTQSDPDRPSSKSERLKADLPLSQPLLAGQALVLQPQVKIEDSSMTPAMDVRAQVKRIEQEFLKNAEALELMKSEAELAELETWFKTYEHGDVEVLVLGTGSSSPSKYRNVSGTIVRIPGWGAMMLDAGEGSFNTLRRMYDEEELSSLMSELKIIWVSHLHADHHLGLTSIINAWNSNRATGRSSTSVDNDQRKLTLVSGEAMSRWLHEYSSVEDIDLSHVTTVATKPPNPVDIPEEITQMTKFFEITSSALDNQPIDCLESLNLTELNTVYVNHCHAAQAISVTFPNGFKLSYSGDCRPSSPFAKIGRDSSLLVHEATFEDDMRSEAFAKKHSTAGEALIVGSEMKAKVVLLTHFSQRYPTMPPLGVDISGISNAVKKTALDGILEDHDEAQPEASQGDTDDFEPETRTRISNHDKNDIRTARMGLIAQADIQRLIDESGMKVVFAFDYMRLKLKNVPMLLEKQKVLRKMYEDNIGKLVTAPVADENHGKNEKKKREKEARKTQWKQEKREKYSGQQSQDQSRRQGSSSQHGSPDSSGQLASNERPSLGAMAASTEHPGLAEQSVAQRAPAEM